MFGGESTSRGDITFLNQCDAHTPFIAMELIIHTIWSVQTACWRQSEPMNIVVFQMRFYLDGLLGLIGLGLACTFLVLNGLIPVFERVSGSLRLFLAISKLVV